MQERRDHNDARIISNQQDTDGSHTYTEGNGSIRQTTYTAPSRSRIAILLGELVPLGIIIMVPFSVHAGMFTSLVSMLQDETVIYERNYDDELVQDTPLLSATTNADPVGARGGGDVIVEEGALVSSGTLGEEEMAEAKTYTGEISVYVVREGDTLSQIAEMFGVNTNTILWANDVTNGVIQPGQSLVILPIAGVRHVVKAGDTMSTIAEKYDSNIDEILEYNQIASIDELSVGDTIVVPGGEIAAPVRVAASPVKTSGSTGSSVGFVHPAPGAVKTQGIHGYNGIDFAVAGGGTTDIRAAAAGQVIVSKSGGWNGGYGNYIVIKHNDGTQTLYAHMSANYVAQGAWVAGGEAIGRMGNTGRSTGTHLHFEVRGARNPF